MDTATSRPAAHRWPRWLLIAAPVAVVLAVVGGLIGWNAAGDSWTYDEQAHRDVVEAFQGDVKDWSAYRDVWLGICSDAKDLGLVAAVFIDEGDSPASFELNIKYTCPDRLGEIPARWRTLS